MTNSLARLTTALADRYIIERELGAGGMATVYLAHDVKHDRKVAVKVLRPELAVVIGAERFVHEIRTTANLQHPHVLPLFDSGESDSFLYYVMPYVEGETLRDKLNRETQLGIEEAVKITTEVADALDYAHRHNVIHRDIKPENILLHDGRPMVVDFGIALALSAAAGGRMTETGLSLGTPHYMSPEQATAEKDLTQRSDIYSLGAVLYEMLTGDPPHTGSSAQQIIMKIVTEEAQAVRELRKSVPPHIAESTAKALEKLPADRFATAAQFAEGLGDARLTPPTLAMAGATPSGANLTPRWRTALPWGMLIVAAVALVLQALNRQPPALVQPMRFVERMPASVAGDLKLDVNLADDGTRLVLPLADGGILVRDLAESAGRVLLESDEAVGLPMFLSPDGRWIAYHDMEEQQLRRISVDGGVPITIAEGVAVLGGGSWGSDNTIVYSTATRSGLWRVAVEGGTPEQITESDPSGGELSHWYPQILPGGEKVLFNVYRTPLDSSTVELVDLDTRQRDVLFRGGRHAQYVSSGHIVYLVRETMWAVPFDIRRYQVTGPAVPVVENVAYDAVDAMGGYSIASNGTLAYIEASAWNFEGLLTWVARDGTEQPALDDWGVYSTPAVSPDGRSVAYRRAMGGEWDIWVVDPAQGGRRVTRNVGVVDSPSWTRDGTNLIYSREQPFYDLFKHAWRTGTQAEKLAASLFDKYPRSTSPDGTELAYMVAAESRDIWILQLDGPPEPRPFRETEANERGAYFSPDGRWFAYESDETGRSEIWLESYPDAERGRRQISNDGGQGPRWSERGELFYRHGSQIVAVQIDLSSGSPGIPSVLFEGPYRLGRREYDVSPDGQRFLMIKPRPGTERRELVVVLNWVEELKAKVGNGRD